MWRGTESEGDERGEEQKEKEMNVERNRRRLMKKNMTQSAICDKITFGFSDVLELNNINGKCLSFFCQVIWLYLAV